MRGTKPLSRLFIPKTYRLTLLATKGDSDAKAMVTITGQKTGPPSRRLTFHQKGLKVTDAEINSHTKKGDQLIKVARTNHHRSFEQVRLHTKEMLYPGRYTVTMEFIIKPPANSENLDRIQAAFETRAKIREFFPSIDEPQAIENSSLEIRTE